MRHLYSSQQINDSGSLIRTEEDSNNDGAIDKILTWFFHSTDEIREYHEDSDADGTPEIIRTYTQNDLGLLQREFRDEDGNLNPEENREYIYNTSGKLVFIEIYTGSTKANRLGIIENFYDSDGNLIKIEARPTDPSIPVTTILRSYDANRNLILIETDNNDDGLIDEKTTLTYFGRNVTTSIIDENNDGTNDLIFTFEYDSNGLLTLEQEEDFRSGYKITTVINTYDDLNRRIRSDTDTDGDLTTIEQSSKYIYDSSGNYIRELRDTDGDGIEDHIVYLYYDLSLSAWNDSLFF